LDGKKKEFLVTFSTQKSARKSYQDFATALETVSESVQGQVATVVVHKMWDISVI
jgi:hypothetical protein